MPRKQTVHLDETLPAREALAEEAVQAADAAPEGPDGKPLQRWVVQLLYQPSRHVWSADAQGAWLAYKRLLGITNSDHKPYVALVDAGGRERPVDIAPWQPTTFFRTEPRV
jgi:hypothetical protein